jgi:hypothetical protein
LAVVVLVQASRDSSDKEDVKVSVGPRSFQLAGAKTQVEASQDTALAQLDQKSIAQPTENNELKNIAKHMLEHSETDSGKSSLSAAELDQRAMRATADASSGMSQIRSDSMDLRKAVMELGLNHGLVASAHEARVTTAANDMDRARSKLHDVAQEQMQLKKTVNDMDRTMEMEHAQFLDGLNKLNEVAHGASTSLAQEFAENEDEQFAQLERQTQNIQKWFDNLKQVKQMKDQMQSKKVEAVKEAEAAGLSSAEVQKELSVRNLPVAPSALELSDVPSKVDDKAKVDKRKHLANVMEDSAVEMAQIESAANDVMNGLDEFAKWKESEDQSPESQEKAAQVKAKLDRALQFLREHEGSVDQRSQQIDKLMKDAGMGHL